MPGHDFEKNVQQQMEELKLPPSLSVWDGVEKEIRKEKRKRRIIIFLLPLLLLLGAGGYFAMQQQGPSVDAIAEKKSSNDTKNTVPATDAAGIPATIDSKQNSGNADPVTANADKTRGSDIANTIDDQTGTSPVPEKTTKVVSDKPLKNALTVAEAKTIVKRNTPKKQKQDIVRQTPVLKKSESVQIVSQEQTTKEKVSDQTTTNSTETVDEVVTAVIIDSAMNNNTPVLPIEPNVVSKKDSIAPALTNIATTDVPGSKKPIKKNSPESKWQFGFQGGAGVSKLAKRFSAFEKSKYADAAFDNLQGNPNPNPAGIPNQPATIAGGFNWNAGMFIQRRFSEKILLSASLQYNYYSTNSNIGIRVDSVALVTNNYSNTLLVNRYYRSGSNTDYHTRYHFVELPVTVHIKLNKSSKFPVYWNNGLSLGYLFSTNTLIYDGRNGYYYKDDELINRTQIGIHTGLTFKLFNQSKHPLEIGPQFNYKLSNLLNSDNDPRHLLSGSLTMRWFLKK